MNKENYILLTIDVEDWFQVENFKPLIPFETWGQRELRIERNVHRLLDLFDSFVLVELDEDPSLRLVGNLLDCHAEEIRIGSPVRVAFEDLGDGIVLPQWRLAEPGGDPS